MSNLTSQLWQLIDISKHGILELRAIWPKGVSGSRPPITKHFRAADYRGTDERKRAVERWAFELNDDGFNIYFVMNQIRSDFDGKSAKDSDIACRKLLLIDIDRVGNTSCPANEAELKAAEKLAEQIAQQLTVKGWDAPIRVMSGNGYHLYCRLDDLPNDARTTDAIAEFLKQLASEFNNDLVAVDTTVSNASRITKLIGTIARKGVESEDRPYRRALICHE